MNATALPLVSTIGERCRVCYQCVRECPAKAIRIADRQGAGAPRAVHRLRRLLQGLHAVGQARGVGRRGRRDAARRPRPRGRHRRAQLPGRVHPTSTTRRSSGRCARSASPASTRWRSAPNSSRSSTAASWPQDSEQALDRHHLPGGRRLRRALLPGPDRRACADRVADGGHGAPASPAARPRPADRLRRAVHREEARDGVARTRGRGGRGADVRRTPPDDRRARHRPGVGRRRASSIRRTAAAAASSRSAAACCRWRASRRTWSPAT